MVLSTIESGVLMSPGIIGKVLVTQLCLALCNTWTTVDLSDSPFNSVSSLFSIFDHLL